MRRRRQYVLVRCPLSEELARGSKAECEFVKAVLQDLAPVHMCTEYLILPVEQWDEE